MIIQKEITLPAFRRGYHLVTSPITNRRLNLGAWQGIYFCEFRNYGGPRRIVLTVYS